MKKISLLAAMLGILSVASCTQEARDYQDNSFTGSVTRINTMTYEFTDTTFQNLADEISILYGCGESANPSGAFSNFIDHIKNIGKADITGAAFGALVGGQTGAVACGSACSIFAAGVEYERCRRDHQTRLLPIAPTTFINDSSYIFTDVVVKEYLNSVSSDSLGWLHNYYVYTEDVNGILCDSIISDLDFFDTAVTNYINSFSGLTSGQKLQLIGMYEHLAQLYDPSDSSDKWLVALKAYYPTSADALEFVRLVIDDMMLMTNSGRVQYVTSILSSNAYNSMPSATKAQVKAMVETALGSLRLWNANSIFYYGNQTSLNNDNHSDN